MGSRRAPGLYATNIIFLFFTKGEDRGVGELDVWGRRLFILCLEVPEGWRVSCAMSIFKRGMLG